MPEPRETHAAIDARRAEPCIAGKEFHDEWMADLCALIPEGDESRYSNPEGAVESIILDCFRVYAAERDALAATVQRVQEWAMVNEIDEPPLAWRGLGDILDAAPSDPATDTGGEGDG